LKTLKKRFVSAFLVLVTLLTLLPTSAFAATGTGTGITPTSNNNFWTTRLLTDGTSYSYKPPMAAGKMLYCMDRGYGYRWGTESFLNSYTYTSATGKDADAVLKTALAESGLGELDAQQLENFKWMMSYITDYTGEIPGSLFMAAQTYVWDHQTFKGEGDGDIDAGGFANADTYEIYCGYIDWMLGQKAIEDAEFQRQIEEYAAQGIIASVVEDDSAKWAVWAKSSVKGRQSFFNYYAPRKLQVGSTPSPAEPDDDPAPPAGDADITLSKVEAGTTKGLNGAKFNIYLDGQIVGSDVTSNGGIIEVNDVTEGLWSFVEVEAPAGYCTDPTPISVYVDTTDGDRQYTVTAENYPLPSLKITKADAQDYSPVTATFSVVGLTNDFTTTVRAEGEATLEALDPGVYRIKEENVEAPYIKTGTHQVIALTAGGGIVEAEFTNYKTPGLEVLKKSIHDDSPIEGVTYRIEQIDGDYTATGTSDAQGRVFFENIPVGSYEISEVSVPDHVILCPVSQTIALGAGETKTATFVNAFKSSITVHKRDADDQSPVEGAVFLIKSADGHSLGEIKTGPDGSATLENIYPQVVEVIEKSVPSPYLLDAENQLVTLLPNQNRDVYVENHKAPTITIEKVDSITQNPLENVRFQVWYASNNTETGEYNDLGIFTTGEDGTVTLTGPDNGLRDGWFRVKELAPPTGYSIKDSDTQEKFVAAGKNATFRFENTPLSAVVVWKKDSVTGAGLGNCLFQLRYLGGSTSGSGGVVIDTFRTSNNGSFTATGLKKGYYIFEEIESDGAHVIDTAPQSFYISGEQQDVITLYFSNAPLGSLLVTKKSSFDDSPLSDVEFTVTTSDGTFWGNNNGKYVTDSTGSFLVENVLPNTTLVVRETKGLDNFVMDDVPKTAKIQSGKVAELEFLNAPYGHLLIRKVGKDNTPLSDVEFTLTTSDGTSIGPSNGKHVTDSAGTILIQNLKPGTTVIAKETRTVPGYLLDSVAQTAVIPSGDTAVLEFRNSIKGNLLIQKYGVKNGKRIPLEGVEFELRYSDGSYVDTEDGKLSSKGIYRTSAEGQILVTNITGTVVVTETASVPGYTIDPDTKTQTVVVNPDDLQVLYFYNNAVGGLELTKVREDDTSVRIPNVTYEIRRAGDDALVDTIVTDSNGRAFLELEDGNYYALEIDCPEAFRLDDTRHYFEVKDGGVTPLQVKNRAFSGIKIHKISSTTGEGIYGVTFLLYDAKQNPIGQYTSDQDGWVYIDDLPGAGKFYLRELENEGYRPDDQMKTVYVEAGATTLIEWENTPITGQIQITKTSEDYNSMNGWPAGTAIPNTIFEVYNAKTGKLADTIKTTKNGVAVTKPLPLGRYRIIESKAADFYGLDQTPIEVEIEFAGQIVRAAMTNKSLYTNVSIKKTGYVEVMPDQTIRYELSGIANNSTTTLTSFYWRDTLPTALRLDKIVTGTWNTPGNYKVVYKTNLSGDSWLTLADNLSTAKSYTLDASPAALGLASNEYITQFMAAFGVVPANFRQVETARVYCTVDTRLSNGAQFVNQADTGGMYNGQWIMATSRWVTKVYAPAKKLPRTGY